MSPCKPSIPIHQCGFTYLWMLLMIALMGTALTLAAEMDQIISKRDRENELLTNGRAFQMAIGSYYEIQQTGKNKEYPSNLDDLLHDPRFPGIKRHLRKIYVDPITGKPEWGLRRVNGRITGVHSLSNNQPIKQANFEAGMESFEYKEKYSDWVFSHPTSTVSKTPDPRAGQTSTTKDPSR